MRLRTRRRVSSPISALPRSTFDTVTTDTPKSRAMSFSLTAIFAPEISPHLKHTQTRARHPKPGGTGADRYQLLSSISYENRVLRHRLHVPATRLSSRT